VELQRHRAAGGECRSHERSLAPEARAGGDVDMHRHAAMLGEERGEFARRRSGHGDFAP